MKIQTLVISEKELSRENVEDFLKEKYPDKYSLIKNWSELEGKFEVRKIDGNKYIVIYEIPDEEFKKELGIFSSIDEAKGAFLSTALEYGWEEVPERYVIYHAEFIEGGNKLIAGIKTEEGVSTYDHLKLEEMVQKLARYPRIVAYSTDVLTYIQDVYPEVMRKAYVIAREIAKVVGEAPSLEELGKVYGVDTSTLEGKLELIEKLLRNPVKLPSGKEVILKPYWYPTEV